MLQFVNGEAPFAGNTNGWILTAFFFFDAWLLGKQRSRLMILLHDRDVDTTTASRQWGYYYIIVLLPAHCSRADVKVVAVGADA